MANISLEFIVDDADVEAGLAKMEAAMSPASLDIYLEELAVPFLQERARFRFSSEGDSASGKWTPLADSTIRFRAHGIETGEYTGISPAHPINKRTGELERFIVSAGAFLTGEGGMYWPGDTGNPRVTDALSRAQGRRNNAPARPVLALGEEDAIGLLGRLGDFFVAAGVAGHA